MRALPSPTSSRVSSLDVAELWKRIESGEREGNHYVALLGLRRYDAPHVVEQIRHGLSFAALARLQRNTGLSWQTLAEVVSIPERTLARRKESGRLDPDESDRLVRAARVFARAIQLFEGDVDGARQWLLTPRPALGGIAPLVFAKTDIGALEVDRVIGRLEHGIPT